MRYGKMTKYDVTNGPGVRTTLFVAGCTHNCKGCFNESLQDFRSGSPWTTSCEYLMVEYSSNPNVDGVSILGGEPLQQTMDDDLLRLLRRLKAEVGKPIWMWTGYTYEEVADHPALEYVDVLVDGRFDINTRSYKLQWRGSSNQRVIDMNATRTTGELQLIEVGGEE